MPIPAPTDCDGIKRLRAVMAALRDPEQGCPWDLEQDFASIAPYTIEEAYEVADAIARQEWDELHSELGDLLLQTIYHGQMAEEAGLFGFDDIAHRVADKMVDRHPHVFGSDNREKSAAQQTRDWETQKARERAAKSRGGVLDDVAMALPALLRAAKLQKRAARVGFDWPNTVQVLDKITEEAAELTAAQEKLSPDEIEDEMGDLLFALANLARHLDVDPEAALRRTNAKFTRRFQAVEAALAAEGKTPQESDLAEMDRLWNEAKKAERG